MNVHSSAGDKKGVAKLSATLTEDATALGVKKQKVSNGIESIEILAPDDFHHHLRDGDVLSHVLPHVVKQFTRVVIMPNLVPPIKNHRDAVAYHDRLMYYTPCEYAVKFQPLMTMYLTDSTS